MRKHFVRFRVLFFIFCLASGPAGASLAILSFRSNPAASHIPQDFLEEALAGTAVYQHNPLNARTYSKVLEHLIGEEGYGPLIRKLSRKHGDTPDDRLDIASYLHSIIEDIYEAYDPTRGVPLPGYMVSMLTTSAYTFARGIWRRSNREISQELVRTDPAGEDPIEALLDQLEMDHRSALIRQALSTLHSSHQDLLRRRFEQNLSYNEISQMSNPPVRLATIRSKVRHALNALRKQIKVAEKSVLLVGKKTQPVTEWPTIDLPEHLDPSNPVQMAWCILATFDDKPAVSEKGMKLLQEAAKKDPSVFDKTLVHLAFDATAKERIVWRPVMQKWGERELLARVRALRGMAHAFLPDYVFPLVSSVFTHLNEDRLGVGFQFWEELVCLARHNPTGLFTTLRDLENSGNSTVRQITYRFLKTEAAENLMWFIYQCAPSLRPIPVMLPPSIYSLFPKRAA